MGDSHRSPLRHPRQQIYVCMATERSTNHAQRPAVAACPRKGCKTTAALWVVLGTNFNFILIFIRYAYLFQIEVVSGGWSEQLKELVYVPNSDHNFDRRFAGAPKHLEGPVFVSLFIKGTIVSSPASDDAERQEARRESDISA